MYVDARWKLRDGDGLGRGPADRGGRICGFLLRCMETPTLVMPRNAAVRGCGPRAHTPNSGNSDPAVFHN